MMFALNPWSTSLGILAILYFSLFPAITAGMMMMSDNQNNQRATQTAEAFGFRNPKVVNVHRWISASINGCGDDWKATKITATNPIGKEVAITVCEGMFFKRATIRY